MLTLFMKLLNISDYCSTIGLHPQTLRKLEREGRSKYTIPARTQGNHRRYAVNDVESANKQIVGYARVSCADQKEDLPRQVEKLQEYANNQISNGISDSFIAITDIGSGLNCKKPGLTRLVKLLLSGTVGELVLTYADRLLRFGAELIFLICRQLNIKVTILQDIADKSIEDTLAADVLAILTVFSAKLYGARSHKNRSLSKLSILAAH